jgi:hypothetical protein
MLNQYKEHGMFGQLMPLSDGANALHMLWTYILKACGTRKSRMVCNENPKHKGSVTLGHVYANALDAASERLFWAIVANEGMTAIGFDVSNAFAEAPPPKLHYNSTLTMLIKNGGRNILETLQYQKNAMLYKSVMQYKDIQSLHIYGRNTLTKYSVNMECNLQT